MAARLAGPVSAGDDDEAGGYVPVADINVTPMVDVMLVLLVIFMVAAPLMTVGVPVQLPKTQAAKVSEPKKPVVVSIDKDGKIYLRDEEMTVDSLAPRLKQLAAEDPAQVVLVRGDRAIDYGHVMELMGQVSAAGFTKVSLIAEAGAGLGGPPAAPGGVPGTVPGGGQGATSGGAPVAVTPATP